ncbi:mannosyltransferase [Frondihabitans sucicola]|uniref:Mannosyltransferase n=1 Tax=Frondihabitans sucicola TaxID=1268041 RepID=A0ABM8GUQ1_9MICO|nr:glycosyltransferase family 39 protein [Frondihabitans sucicola]BDZ52054.1 mannosyltransferase [Frondihabitans sucicola]
MLGHVDAVHGAYYLGLHFWIQVFGASPASVRLPSALASGVLVVGVSVLVRRLGTRRLAVVSSLVVAILPRVTSFGEEARSYAFGAMIAVWLLVLVVRLAERPMAGMRWWMLYSMLLAAGIYTFLYVGLLIAVHAVVLLAARVPRSTLARWAKATGVGIVLAAPVLVYGLAQHGQVSFLAARDSVTPTSVLVSTWFGSVPLAVAGWVMIGVAAVFVAADLLRGRSFAARGARPVSLTTLALAWLLVPLGILLLGNVAVADFSPRYLSSSAPAAGILVATGIVRLAGLLADSRRGSLVASMLGLALVAGLAAPVFAAQRTPYAKNGTGWQSVSQVVGAHATPGDAVVFDESTGPSRRTRLAALTYPDGFRGLNDVTLKTSFVDSDWWYSDAYPVEQALAKGRFDGVTRVWVVEDGGDDYGLAELRAAGFTVAESYSAHRSRILELTR